ncbi:hypothetical protein MATL_G00029220 [Megalops atlanticus]|uniref:Uncharacterized protein n=1 Tax=Megalops atlanticus TaxID=7932 RepID=A0A9D3QH06_MEGAT|nr:hypothetical protein MATL_G00029220 [Megalops atlanticus]
MIGYLMLGPGSGLSEVAPSAWLALRKPGSKARGWQQVAQMALPLPSIGFEGLRRDQVGEVKLAPVYKDNGNRLRRDSSESQGVYTETALEDSSDHRPVSL